ncbi:MAG: AAA family ATPase [Planctomycetota bacterium]|nr:AAA family ATPase [Planctomycetota bacterium]MEC9157227.1 AAA family ATPase [Planctomycetota bacterium]MED6306929.1 AAA family ATPase [Planctomycetota bacterium]
MRTIAMVNQKGGCGKTTTAINLSAEFARRSLRVLLIDLDPQGHCAAGLGVPESSITRGIEDALEADLGYEPDLVDEMIWEVGSGLNLIPCTVRLTNFESADHGNAEQHDRDRRLLHVLELVQDRFDVCIVDCPPAIGWLTFNALRAADETLVPVETGYFALKGAIRQAKTIDTVIKRIGRPLDFFLLPTLHDESSARSENILSAIRTRFGDQVAPLVVREHESLREAASMGQPVQEFAPDSPASEDFARLADWILGHQQTTIAVERARQHQEETDRATLRAEDPRPDSQQPAPSALEESRPSPPVPEPNERVQAVLQRVGRHEAGASPGVVFDVQRLPEGVLDRVRSAPQGLQSLVVDPTKSGDGDHEPGRFGAFAIPEGVCFRQPAGTGSTVAVTGDFNDWAREGEPLAPRGPAGDHEVILPLPPGTYRYRLLVDGTPAPDPHATSVEASDPTTCLLEIPAST